MINAFSGNMLGKNCLVVSPTILIMIAKSGNIIAEYQSPLFRFFSSFVAKIRCHKSGATRIPILPSNKNHIKLPLHKEIILNSDIGIEVLPNKKIATVKLIINMIIN